MFTIFFGCLAVVLGVLWALWPQILRGWAVGKISWTIFWPLFFLFFSPAVSWAGRWGIKGQVLACAGFYVMGSFLRAAISRGAEKIPLICFRAVGILNILSGLGLIYFKRG